MPNKNALNKNSLYVQSLVDFILDTKPYHVKLTEIVEEYRFFDDVRVKVEERLTSRTKIDSTWTYNYFSSANPLFRAMQAAGLTSPTFRAESHVVGRDENTDLALVPFAYSKRSFDGPGVHAVYLRRPDFTEPLTESVDYFQSHGSFQFQIKQTVNANGELDPLWATTPDDDLISEARRQTRRQALDRDNPESSVNRIRALLDEIRDAALSVGGHEEVEEELRRLYEVLDSGDLPGRQNWTSQYDASVDLTYAALFAWLAVPNARDLLVPLEAPHDREYFEQQLSRYSSPLFFGMFTDLGVRESGRVDYDPERGRHIAVSGLEVASGKDIEEWTLTSSDDVPNVYRVTGSSSGFVGQVISGERFDNGRVSFNTEHLSDSEPGDVVSLAPTRKVVVGADAPLETWNVIKVNPIAHDRPQFSTRSLGYIQDAGGVQGSVSILSDTVPTGEVVLTSRGDGFFEMTSTADPGRAATVQVGVPYDDGQLAFTIVRGQRDFQRGERFYISVENLPARAENLDLGYGYDMDPYDDDTLTKYPYSDELPVGFYYDGRFLDFDLSSLGLRITDAAVDGRKWRLRALPNYDLPIATVPGDPSPRADLRIYFADRFALEFSDDDFRTKTVVAEVGEGKAFSSDEHGISFRVASGSRPFVAVSADDDGQRVEGGDIFSFEVRNPGPRLVEAPVVLTASNVPRLIMHSDSFHRAPAASWAVRFASPTEYTVTGAHGEQAYGPAHGTLPTPGAGEREGHSFRGLGVHFTVVPGSGISAGDVFTFNTFDEKPSYLVHGSVTGFTAPATVGRYYWNGRIGFKIKPPEARAYVGGQRVDLGAEIDIREDCPSLVYTFTRAAGGYQVSRSDTGERGFGTTSYRDRYIDIDLLGVDLPEFRLAVDAHDLPLWNSADVVIVNPSLRSKLPREGDVVVIEKAEEGRLSLNMVPGLTNVSALGPVTIDQRFIDTNTRGEGRVPLASTSPETALLQGWVPLTVSRRDSATSPAEFSDHAAAHDFRSASDGQPVGTLTGTTFEWDPTFYARYLPLNAEANLVVQGTGWNDRVSARITESVKFLLGGGAAVEDWMFRDEMQVTITDANRIDIVSRYNDDIRAIVEDGPFAGFMPGYGNVPYDTEGYDMGQPPDLYSLLAHAGMTDDERADAVAQWNNYLSSPVPPTTEAQWAYLRAALAGDPNPGLVTPEMGFPVLGMGMDVVDRPENSASASIVEAVTMRIIDRGNPLESNAYDVGMLDRVGENLVVMHAGSMPPVPPGGVPAGSTYDSFDTPLTAEEPAQVFEVSFNAPAAQLAAMSPTFSIWLPDAPAPVRVAVAERVKPGVFRLSLARPSRAKIVVG